MSAIFGILAKPGGGGGGEGPVQETGVLGEKVCVGGGMFFYVHVHVCVCENVKFTCTLQLQVKNLRHALTSSHNENQFLRARLAKIQMASLPPLHLVPLCEEKKEKDSASVEDSNQTDQEKAVARQVSNLQKVSHTWGAPSLCGNGAKYEGYV